MEADRFEPARSWKALDNRRPPDTWQDKRPIRRDIHHLARAHAQDRMYARLDKEGERGVGTQPPIRHEHVPWVSGRMDRLPPSAIVSDEGRDHPRQEHPGAGMEQPEEPRDGNAAPRPLYRRLTKCVL
jgi:hypothetical protein